jgi:DNA-binding transcriptional LysR family regulator
MAKSGLTFRKMEMVEAVAKLGSVSAAAEALGISQPALTQGLQSVEAELGITLFNRGPGGLQPTGFARPFLNHIDTIRIGLTETKLELAQTKAAPSPRHLRVSAGIRSCKIWVDAATDALRHSNPDLHLNVDNDILQLYSRLIGDEVDIGVTMTDLIPEASKRIIIEPLGQWRVIFICRPTHPLARQNDLTFDQLRAFPLAGHFNYPVISRLFNEENGEFGRLDMSTGWPTLSSPTETLDFLISVVTSQDCLAIVPRSTVERELAEGSLVALEIARNTRFVINLVLVYLREKASLPALQQFVDSIKQIERQRLSED